MEQNSIKYNDIWVCLESLMCIKFHKKIFWIRVGYSLKWNAKGLYDYSYNVERKEDISEKEKMKKESFARLLIAAKAKDVCIIQRDENWK